MPLTETGRVLPGRDSIHATEWFITHAKPYVIFVHHTPITDPPNAILTNPQGTNMVAKGNTIRLVSRKYELTYPK